jgi:ubiquinone/menaquinone biosynthesis C-methylase UbiE
MRKTIVEEHFDKVAKNYDYYKNKNSFYYQNLKKLLGKLIQKNKKVFEIGCGTGDLLNYLRPKYGYGYDISSEMISISKSKFLISKNLTFSTEWPRENFDYIFMSDVIEHLENPTEVFQKISKLMTKNTVFINTMANPIWEPFLMFAEKLGLKMPEGPHNRAGIKECRLWIEESGMKIVKHDYKLLIPVNIPIVTKLANKYLEKYFKRLAFIEYFVIQKNF